MTRILYVVQRYGTEIVGGSETACRHFAEHLASAGHDVHVLTSCARNYVDWADEYQPGTHTISGVQVHRLPVAMPRRDEDFGPLHHHMMSQPTRTPRYEQLRWARLMGPQIDGMTQWLLEKCVDFDVVIFMTYLYYTSTYGIPAVAGRTPVIMQPTAHDEPPAYVPLYQTLFRHPDAFLFFTEEEREVVRRLYRVDAVGDVVGIGMGLRHQRANSEDFRRRWSIGESEYLIYVGRLDSSKGVAELIRYFEAFKERVDSDLMLVLVGEGTLSIPERPDILVTGFLEESEKASAIAGSLALVVPSYFESFSIALCESWLQRRPALVQRTCEVLEGQARRSGGALTYNGYAEFEVAVELLLEDASLAASMGLAGEKYVVENYDWETVLNRVQSTIDVARKRFIARRIRTTPLQ